MNSFPDLAAARNHDGDDVVAARTDSAGERQDVGQPRVDIVKRIAPGAGNLTEHRNLPAAHLDHGQAHLRIPEVIALPQSLGDPNPPLRGRLPGERDLADQRKHDRAALGDARFRGEIRILEHRHAYAVARSESLAGIGSTLDRQCQERDSGQCSEPP